MPVLHGHPSKDAFPEDCGTSPTTPRCDRAKYPRSDKPVDLHFIQCFCKEQQCSKALETNCSIPSYFRFHYIPLQLQAHARQKGKGLLATMCG